MQSYEEIRGMVMRGWFKQGSRLILSVAVSIAFIVPSISSAEVIQETPSSIAMAGDAIVVRPLLLVATVLGTAIFIVTLPFSALGGNTPEAAHELMGVPADSLFFRCLGCTGQEDSARDQQTAEIMKEEAAVNAVAEEAKTP